MSKSRKLGELIVNSDRSDVARVVEKIAGHVSVVSVAERIEQLILNRVGAAIEQTVIAVLDSASWQATRAERPSDTVN
jgi:hypothetical protein